MRRTGMMLAAAIAICAPAAAQNVDLDPSYGTTTLASGFRPDPFTVEVRAGGSIDAQSINPACKGFIASAPDLRIIFSAGALPLIISAASDADTTLVVHGPEGGWYCDDNSGANGRNPSLRFNHPQSGQYDIWIGAPAGDRLQAAELDISEAMSQ
ncbi:MAG: peptidase S1 [Proteobacteria bacterium]|nr:peptidase S1 [Pseudomonadota bacterium]